MKLQKRFNRKVGNKEYNKWVLVLPQDEVEKLGWKEGVELEPNIKDGKLVLTPKGKEKRDSKSGAASAY
ncbi:AbrB/MazE/SpoVT family DNA-binding domain-containing protein [Nitrososphaera sp.]|uniref:AbrB/MazE/SpoVT family DNA-binding domain-containing protein n=1 Tax=Nitrososphaera sp. TaxID=1971748 RepID=UPI0017B73A92|nr:AbrB/MazE/SpoVT family DNA-binding domain-containing protein [Nitrososphaera sp.]NWG37851.1 AbrB/MazE/SpoVT family DNA-binding domain-containing protein [Nitrososphaera sp.]